MKYLIATTIIAALFIAGCASSSSSKYPLTYCLVSGNDLGSMGDPFVYNHEGQQIKFCCKPCLRKFKKDTPKYLERLTGPRPSEAQRVDEY